MMKKRWKRLAFLLSVSAVLFVILLRIFLFTPIIVHGESMKYEFEDLDHVVMMKKTTVERFDIVIIDVGIDDESYMKRVIGLPGETIEFQHNRLFVNGYLLEEPFLSEDAVTEDFDLSLLDAVTVPEDHYFVLGDNRQISLDSRDASIGFVAAGQITGEVKARFWPLGKLAAY